jgi:hypothetical protein
MFWVIATIVTFLFFLWLFKVPYLKYDTQINKLRPFGLKLWILLCIILFSLVPILNLTGIIVGIIFFFVWKVEEELDYEEIFPSIKTNKFFNFLNKKL